MADSECLPDFAAEERDKIGLPEAGKNGQQQTAHQPAEVFTDKGKRFQAG